MKKIFQVASAFLIATALAFVGVAGASAADFNVPPAPSLESPVVDTSGTLSADQIKQVVDAIHNVKVAGKSQLAVLVVNSLNGTAIEDASLAVARTWGIGEKNNNNGVLLMVAVSDHKMRIEVGSGLEGALPDIRTKQISDTYITPAFKKGDYFTGIRDGVVQINAAVAGEVFAAPPAPPFDATPLVIILVILALIITGLVIAYRRYRRNGGGVGGSGGDSTNGFFAGYLLGSDSGSSGSSSSYSGYSSGGGDSFGGGGFDGGGSDSSW